MRREIVAHRADAGVEGMQRKWEDNILSVELLPDTDSHRWRNGKNQQVTIAKRKGTANIGTFREDAYFLKYYLQPFELFVLLLQKR